MNTLRQTEISGSSSVDLFISGLISEELSFQCESPPDSHLPKTVTGPGGNSVQMSTCWRVCPTTEHRDGAARSLTSFTSTGDALPSSTSDVAPSHRKPGHNGCFIRDKGCLTKGLFALFGQPNRCFGLLRFLWDPVVYTIGRCSSLFR
jgi:hypothetical protein